jgi:hypothetical protein
MNIKRTERRARAAIDGLAALIALAIGCGSAETAAAGSPVQALDGGADAALAPGDASPADAAPAEVGASDPADAATPDSPGTTADSSTGASSPDASSTATGPQACGFTPCAPGAPCPDLVVDIDDLRASTLIATRTFAPTDCAVVEGCITTPGARRLLRFDTASANIGTADLSIGDPTQNACFQYSDCHMHYHFKGVGQYTLYQADGVTVAAVGHKQGFCLEDVEPYEPDPGPEPATPFSCDNQGLHVGWEDVYPNDIDCQWIDITGVAAGNYVLSVLINGSHYLPESNYDNNEARIPIAIPAP